MKVGEKLKNTLLDVAQNFDKMSDSEKAEVNDNVRKQFYNIIYGKPPKTKREKEFDKLARERRKPFTIILFIGTTTNVEVMDFLH